VNGHSRTASRSASFVQRFGQSRLLLAACAWRLHPSAWWTLLAVFLTVLLPADPLPAQRLARRPHPTFGHAPRMELVPPSRFRAAKTHQDAVTRELGLAYEHLAWAGALPGLGVDVNEALLAIAAAGHWSHRLAGIGALEPPTLLVVAVVDLCSEDSASAWRDEEAWPRETGVRGIEDLVGRLERFDLNRPLRLVRAVRQELERSPETNEGTVEAAALLRQAEERLLEAGRRFEKGVITPFQRSLAAGAARLRDPSAREAACLAWRREPERENRLWLRGVPRRTGLFSDEPADRQIPDLSRLRAHRERVGGSIRQSLAVVDEALSPAGAAEVRRLAAGLTPPALTNMEPPVWGSFALAACIGGEVTVRATVDREGVPTGVVVERGVPGLDAAAVETVRQWRFRPAVFEGEPVESSWLQTVTFRLPRSENQRCHQLRQGW